MQSGGPDEAWASGEGGEGSRTAVATLGGGLGGLAWGGRARERVRTAGQGSYCMSSEQQAAGRAGQTVDGDFQQRGFRRSSQQACGPWVAAGMPSGARTL